MLTEGPWAACVAIPERALIQRVNRKLKADGEKLRTARMFSDGHNLHENTNLDRYYVIVDLEAYSRDLCVLREWEKVSG